MKARTQVRANPQGMGGGCEMEVGLHGFSTNSGRYIINTVILHFPLKIINLIFSGFFSRPRPVLGCMGGGDLDS